MRVGLPACEEPQFIGKHRRLKRNSLSTSGIVFLVMSAAAPLSILAGAGPLTLSIAGVGAPVCYLAAGVALTIFAVGFTAMTRYVKTSGAFYAYVTRGLGAPLGLGAAVLALVSYNGLQIGLYGLLAVQAQNTLAGFGLSVPWPAIALVAIGLVWALGRRGIEVGTKVLGVLLTAETAILLMLAVSVVAHRGAAGLSLTSFTPHAALTPATGAVLAFAFAAFLGFESTALYREEARHPQHTIPRATFIAVVFMGITYTFIMWAMVQAFGDSQVQQIAGANTAELFFIAVQKYVGLWASSLMHLLIITSIYASQLAFHNAINRYFFALSNDRVLPSWLGVVHPRLHSPHRAGLAQSLLALLVVGLFAALRLDPYRQLMVWASAPAVVGIMALQALTAMAVVVFFLRNRQYLESRLTVPAAVVSALMLCGVTGLIVRNMDLLSKAGPTVNALLVSFTPASLIVGVAIAWRLRALRPDLYALVGVSGRDDRPLARRLPLPRPHIAPSTG